MVRLETHIVKIFQDINRNIVKEFLIKHNSQFSIMCVNIYNVVMPFSEHRES